MNPLANGRGLYHTKCICFWFFFFNESEKDAKIQLYFCNSSVELHTPKDQSSVRIVGKYTSSMVSTIFLAAASLPG
jgi:hypothetical protein